MVKILKSCKLIEEDPISRQDILKVFHNTPRLASVKYHLNLVGLEIKTCSLNQLYDMLLATDFFMKSEDEKNLIAVDITTNPEAIQGEINKFNEILPYLQQLKINYCLVLFIDETTFADYFDVIELWSKCRDYSNVLFNKIEQMKSKDLWADKLIL